MTARYNPAAQILIIEDDSPLGQKLTGMLCARGYCVAQCSSGWQGLIAAMKRHQDLIVLGTRLPDMSGFEVLKRLRRNRGTPVMLLSAGGSEVERIRGYQQGADDCISGACSLPELTVRIDALLRRTRSLQPLQQEPGVLRAGDLAMDRSELAAWFRGQMITLTPIQFRLLWVLLLNSTEPLSKPYLYRAVLDKDYCRYDRSLDMHLSRVRRKLVAAGMSPDRLQTIHGHGYCLS